MQELLKNKKFLGGVAIALLALFGFNMFFGSEDVVLVGEGIVVETPGEDLLKLSAELSQVTLGQDLFSSLPYQKLVDFAKPVVEGPLGRTNPFDVIGRD